MSLEITLERTTPAAAQWVAWSQRTPSLAGLAYDDLRSQLRTASQPRKDELLGALVRLVQADSRAFGFLAACLLPGLRHRIARHAPSLDREEALTVMVDALYEVVASYDAAQHHQFIAEELLALPTRRLRRAVVAHRIWSGHVRRLTTDGARVGALAGQVDNAAAARPSFSAPSAVSSSTIRTKFGCSRPETRNVHRYERR